MRTLRAGARRKDPRTRALRARAAQRFADTPGRTPRPSRERTAARGCSSREAVGPCSASAGVRDRGLAGFGADARTKHDPLRGRLTPQLGIDSQMKLVL